MFYKVAQQFKKPSGLLGRFISNIMSKGTKPAYITLITEMNIQPGEKLLEIGYGPGVGMREIFNRANPGIYYGIDFSELMFEKASRTNQKLIEAGKVQLMSGDFLTAEIHESDFDRVFCSNVVYFWKDLVVPFLKIRSLLKDGGKFHFFMESKEDLDRQRFTDDDVFNKHSTEKAIADLKLAGFSQVTYFYKRGYFVEADR
jgi:ubiquinone/menaquinone biosynthesis C-methylase UbiE